MHFLPCSHHRALFLNKQASAVCVYEEELSACPELFFDAWILLSADVLVISAFVSRFAVSR